jgi:hypothetical protein
VKLGLVTTHIWYEIVGVVFNERKTTQEEEEAYQ